MRFPGWWFAIVASLSATLAAQSSATGTYGGTYTLADEVNCKNMSVFKYSGVLEGGVTQTGNQLRGLFVAHNGQTIFYGGGTCTIVPYPEPFVELIQATINGTTVTGTMKVGTRTDPWTGTWNGTTLSGNTKKGDVINVTRRSTAAGPLAVLSSDYYSAAYVPRKLRWMSVGATTIRIEGVGSSTQANGEMAVGPIGTTVYVLTATGDSGTTRTETTVPVSRSPPIDVVLSDSPRGMLHAAGSSPPSDRITLTNIGGDPTTVTLSPGGSGFTVSPASFNLVPLGSQVVTITATDDQSFDGSLHVSGAGVVSGLTVPVRSLSGIAPPVGVVVKASRQRIDLAAPAGENPGGAVSFTNTGANPVNGLLVSDAPWIVVPAAHLTLAPGETREVPFSIDRARRPSSLIGGAVGALTFRYLNSAGGAAVVTDVPVAIADVVKFATVPLEIAQRGFFLPAAVSGPTSHSDIAFTHIHQGPLGTDLGFTPVSNPGDTSAPARRAAITKQDVVDWRIFWSITFPGMVSTLFDDSGPRSGTVHPVDTLYGFIFASHTRIHSRGDRSLFTSMPIFRSAQPAFEDLYLPGVQKNASTTTTVFIQELGIGPATSVLVESLDAEGRVLRSRTVSFPQSGALELPDEVPAGAATVRVRNQASGWINALALVTDEVTGDLFTIAQLLPFPGTAPAASELFFPAFGAGSTEVEMVLNLANSSNTPITISAKTLPGRGPRRRPVGHTIPGSVGTPASITIPAYGTRQLQVAAGGVVKLSGSPALRAAGTYSIRTADGGRIGSGVVAVPPSHAISPAIPRQTDYFVAGMMRYNGVEDSTPETIAAGHQLTWRSNLHLFETTGQPVTVTLALRYTFSGGSSINDSAGFTRSFDVPGGGLLSIEDLGRAILGERRSALGDLHNAWLEIRVLSGAGAVIPFLQVIDNGTGDVAIRYQ